jgi:DNA polymerase-3 subunit epsilon
MILFYDLETTGLDPERSRIVELAALEGPEGRKVYLGRFDPGVPIPLEAARVHGITDEAVRGAPSFAEEAGALQRLFEGRLLCGYNIRRFDTPLLDAELRRAGQPGLDLTAVREIDLYRVWATLEPAGWPGGRTLAAAVARYLGRSHEDAHASASDTAVLPGLLEAVRETHGLGEEELLDLSAPSWEVDRAGKLRRAEGGIVFDFGRHAGEPVSGRPDYVDWILRSDFPEETKRILRELREEG